MGIPARWHPARRSIGFCCPGLRPGTRCEAKSTSTSTSTAAVGMLGLAGRCGLAGHAVNPPPGSGPAAGGWAFGRLRSSASQAKRPHPWGLGRRIHAPHGFALAPRPSASSIACACLSRRVAGRRKIKFKGKSRSRRLFAFAFAPALGLMHPRPQETVEGRPGGLRRTVGAMDGAIEPPGVRALCLRSTASQAPERTAASGWAGPRSGVYGVSCIGLASRL